MQPREKAFKKTPSYSVTSTPNHWQEGEPLVKMPVTVDRSTCVCIHV